MSLLTRYLYPILISALAGALVLTAGCTSEPPSMPVPTASPTTERLTFYTEQLPPYNYVENGTLKGISVDLLEAITAKTGTNMTREQVHLVPWTEGYQTVLTRNNTVLFTTARLPDREQSFKWAGPIWTYTNVLFARPDRGIVIEGLESLKGYRIGVIADDVAIQQLLDAGVNKSQLVAETDVSAIVAKLESGEIDLWAYPKAPGRYFTGKLTGNYYSFRIVYTLPELEGWYVFNRDVPDSTVQSFQQALDAIKTEKDARGTTSYERILGRNLPVIGLAQLTYLTEEWPPFNYEKDGIPAGIGVEILEAIFRDTGVNRSRVDVRIVPLSDALRQAQDPTGTVVFSIVHSPEREPLYKWAGPFTRGSFVVFAPVSKNITITADEDLNTYRIGAVKGTIENTLLTNRGVNPSRVVNGPVPADLIAMLEDGEIDLWATGDITGRYEMTVTGADPDAYEIVYTLSENDFNFIFSRDVPDELVDAFSQAIVMVRDQKDAQGISEYERIIYRNIGVGCTRQPFTDDEVVALVEVTARDIARDAPGTFRRINAGEAPYRDAENPELYVFVYDTRETFVAHADNIQLVGVSFKGKTDVTGKPLHDEIINGALKNGTGWVEYVYMNPVQTNLYYKTTYYALTKGSDGNSYIVCSGNFRPCNA
jgi:polar amino acid transport system substrate-binding protein